MKSFEEPNQAMLIKRIIRLLVVGLLARMAGADAEHWTVNGIKPGLNQSEVIEILGPPQGEEDSRDWDGIPTHTLKFQNSDIRVVFKRDAVCEITGSSLERDGIILTKRGFPYSKSLKALGTPLSSAPELNTGSHFLRGQDVYPGEPISVRVNYWEGKVEDIHFCEKCGLNSDASPLERQWRLAQLAFQAAENREDFKGMREHLREMLAVARESGPESKRMGDTLMRIYWSRAFDNGVVGERPPEAGANSLDLLKRAVEIYEKSAPPLNEDIVNALDFLATEYQNSGDLAHTEVCYRRAIELERIREPESWVMGRLLGDYVDLLRRLGDPKAELLAKDARPIWKKHGMRDSPSHALIRIPLPGNDLLSQQRTLFALPYSQFKSQPQLALLQSKKLYASIYSLYIRNARPTPTKRDILDSLRREAATMLKEVKLSPKLADRILDPQAAFQQFSSGQPKIDPELCNQALVRGLMAVQGGDLLSRHELTEQEASTLAAARALDRRDFRILGGIGVFLQERAGQFFISEPFARGPAQIAGLQPGDAILSVDRRKLSGLSLEQVRRLITGEVGSKVELEISRAGEAPRPVPVVRARLQSTPVSFRQIENTGYIRMRSPAELTAQLARVRGGELNGLILDIRQARGGLNDEVISFLGSPPPTGLEQLSDIASPLVSRGTILASIGSQQIVTSKEPLLGTLPVVVLIDHGTSDSLEVLASALKHRPQTILLGEQSSGRSVLFKELKVPGFPDLTLRIGATEIADATGKVLTGHGVLPDQVLPMDSVWIGHESKDIQLARAISLLNTPDAVK